MSKENIFEGLTDLMVKKTEEYQKQYIYEGMEEFFHKLPDYAQKWLMSLEECSKIFNIPLSELKQMQASNEYEFFMCNRISPYMDSFTDYYLKMKRSQK